VNSHNICIFVWHISLSIQVEAHIRILLLFEAEYSIVCIYILFILSSIDGHLGWLWWLVLLWKWVRFSAFRSLGWKTRGGIAGSYDTSVCWFVCLDGVSLDLPLYLPVAAAPFYILTTVYKGLHFSTSSPATYFFFDVFCLFLILAILAKWHHCGFDIHFHIIKDVGHLFKCLLAFCISSEKGSF
jgi:hypothetical protein